MGHLLNICPNTSSYGFSFASICFLNRFIPGDEFEIKLGKKAIRLVPVGGSEEED